MQLNFMDERVAMSAASSVKFRRVDVGNFGHFHEVDGRLWQLDFAGQSVRFLVP